MKVYCRNSTNGHSNFGYEDESSIGTVRYNQILIDHYILDDQSECKIGLISFLVRLQKRNWQKKETSNPHL